MPSALFTSAKRDALLAAEAFAEAERIAVGTDEDVFQFGRCEVTCRYWLQGGDFVSKQILGCHHAIHVGSLQCDQESIALDRVDATETIIGIVGPEEAVATLVQRFAEQFSGVIVTQIAAIVAG